MSDLLAEFLRSFTATNQWMAILPEIVMVLLALSLLGFEMLFPKSSRTAVQRISVYGQLVVLALLVVFPKGFTPDAELLFSGMLVQTDFTHLMRGFFVVCSILVAYLGGIYLEKQPLARTEFYHLVLLVAAAMMVLVQSANFVMLFVALETVTVAFYVLVAYGRNSVFSLEGGLKYLILGAMSSAILLFGIVLLYGIGGNPALPGASADSLNYLALQDFITLNPDNLVVQAGTLLVLAGICFKIGAVPFQIWVPDVYQGAPTPVTAYLAVGSKAAGFVILLQVLSGPFAPLSDFLIPVLSVIAGVTILFGNLAAINQRNVKRLMGLSGVAHAGYLMLGVIAVLAGIEWAKAAIVFYLVTYLLGSFAVFGVMALVSSSADADQELDDYENFARKNPFLGGVLAVGLGSLAGIPPLGGFIGKLFLFVAAFQAGLYGLLVIAVLGVVISIYYYFGWIRRAYFSGLDDVKGLQCARTQANNLVLFLLVSGTVLLGLFPGLFPVMP